MRKQSLYVLIACVAVMLPWSIKQIERPVFNDFAVYWTASKIVRAGGRAAIYDGADNGQDPQQKAAAPGSLFDSTAIEYGTRTSARTGSPEIMLYLYPPALADMVLPLTFLPFRAACAVWMALSIAALAGTAVLLARLAGWRVLDWRTGLLFVAILLCRPVEWCLLLGQVTVFLLLLWTAGICLYARGYHRASAVCLGLAAVIKLTPLFVILPFLLWREWRWVRWFCGTVAVSAAAMLAINGRAALSDFFLHVMPAMSNGVVEISNLSLVAGTQMFYVGVHGGDPWMPFPPPHWVALLGKLLAAAALAAFALVLFQLRKAGASHRMLLLSFAALLSTCVAPVAWRHAYTVAFLALFFVWRRALAAPVPAWMLALLSLFTLELNFVLDSIFVHHAHGAVLSTTPLLLPLLSLAVVFTWSRALPDSISNSAAA